MSSLGGILNTARNALTAHSLSTQVASHNIANAGREGYSRQRVELTAAPSLHRPEGSVGTGVVVSNITRARDAFADVAVRRDTGKVSGYSVRQDVLSEVEGIFGEPSETGIGATLDRFWNSWSDLSNQPTSTSAKTSVRQKGEQVVAAINDASARLSEVESGVRTRVASTVEDVNRIAKQIADLNVQVVRAESGGKTAGDLRDMLDRLVDQLATLGSTRAIQHGNGGLSVTLDGLGLVDAGTHHEVSTEFVDGKLVVMVGDSPAVVTGDGASKLGELTRLYNQDLPAVRADLDALARGLVTTVNALHRQGKTEAGDAVVPKPVGWDPAVEPSLVDFFQEPTAPATVTATTLSLSAAVRADAAVIAAGYTSGGEGDNRLALDIAALRTDSTTMTSPSGPTTYDGYYRGMVTRVAQDISSAENSIVVYESLAAQALNRRESVSGVSTDEELIKLMQSQQAYVAATRLVTMVDEMTQSLLNMV